ncbi:hypothetical protein RJ641_010602 [Dillenia turbinata]|uniref:HMA domain-containing protein n=1 Tax=Dillenia turbinata TaxID=194707 RepID=A0AAN8VBS1_9MAGN
MVQTVLKVDVSCLKCKKQLLKSISQLIGVDKIEVDAAKGASRSRPIRDHNAIEESRKFVDVLVLGPHLSTQSKRPKRSPRGKGPLKRSLKFITLKPAHFGGRRLSSTWLAEKNSIIHAPFLAHPIF